MADSYFNFEAWLRDLGVIERGDVTLASGLQANQKINLKNVPEQDPRLAAEIAKDLATRLAFYKPEILIPVPHGADKWAKLTAEQMGLESIELEWVNKELGRLRFIGVTGIDKARRVGRIAVIEDVVTTGGRIKMVTAHPDIAGKVVAAGAVWTRSQDSPPMDFPLETVIDSYVPSIEND